ncbi:MAG: PfkB family carbohydrate kinase [Solirubrobacteraceae bacterium]
MSVAAPARPAVALFAPNPLLTLDVRERDRERIRMGAGGQGVQVAAAAGAVGATPVLCGFAGGESGTLLRPLLERATGAPAYLVRTAGASGWRVTDRREGRHEVMAMQVSVPPSEQELDELIALSCAHALACEWLVVTNPLPAEALPLEVYRQIVGDAHVGGARTLLDLASPRLDSAVAGEPDLVKLNESELGDFIHGSVSTPALMLAAASILRRRGALNVIVTRGRLPAMVLHGNEVWRLSSPRFRYGSGEGCGDAMMGALSAAWAIGDGFERALVLGAAAGAASFLSRGLGRPSSALIGQLADRVVLESWPASQLDEESA